MQPIIQDMMCVWVSNCLLAHVDLNRIIRQFNNCTLFLLTLSCYRYLYFPDLVFMSVYCSYCVADVL